MRVVLPLIHLDEVVFTPLPQLRLKNALVDAGYDPDEIVILEYRRDGSLQAMLDDILRYQPTVVGFSCYTWNFVAVERLSQAIKSHSPHVTIVWGGPHVSEVPERFLGRYSRSVDLIVTWYGERAITDIAERLGGAPARVAQEIPGIWALDGDVVMGRQTTAYPALSALGYPYRYIPPSVRERIADRVFLVESIRGCPFSCRYCLWGQADKHLDALSSDEMISQMYQTVDDGARIFMYADAGLGLIREGGQQRDLIVYRRFADDGYLARKGVQIRGYFFWQTLNDELLEVIADLISQGVMGQLDIGIQTFNKAVLPDLQRPTNYDKFLDTVNRLHQHKIRFSLDLILGLPGDTLAGFRGSLQSVIRCRPDRTQSFPLSILPGTGYDLRREQLGIKTIRGSYRDDAETVIATATMPHQDMLAALELESWMFLYYAEGLFAEALNRLAVETGREELAVLESLKFWAEDNGPYLMALVNTYREKLYDSRSDGRYLLEAKLMETFTEVYQELAAWLRCERSSEAVLDSLRHALLAFPKTIAVAARLDSIDGITYDPSARLLTRNGFRYRWRQDPVIGAIVRNRNFYRWSTEAEPKQAVDLTSTDDLLQGVRS